MPYYVGRLNSKTDDLNARIGRLEMSHDDNRVLAGKMYAKLLEKESSQNIHDYEFKVFSQYGDDGIIQYLVRKLNITEKTFVEFGVENYREANTRFLLINNNWKGLIIDGAEKNIRQIKSEELYWKHNLTAVAAFVTRNNINTLLSQHGFSGELGILHIDIDGNDYWIWKEITAVQPQLVIMEYNAVFQLHPWTVPYEEKFYRTDKHHSNLYFGASLSALNALAEEKGYSFVGCNSHGNNAYFVRNDKLNGIKKLSPDEGFVMSQFRESRNPSGELTFVSEAERIKLIKGMPVFNTLTGNTELI